MFKSTIYAFIIKVIAAASAFIFNLAIARNLDADQAGYFFIVQALALFLGNISRLGFDNVMVRYISSYNIMGEVGKVSKVYIFAFRKILCVSLVGTIIVYFLSKEISIYIFDKPNLYLSLRAGCWAIIPLAIAPFFGFCFQGEKKTVFAMLYQSGLLAIFSVIAIYLISPYTSVQALVLYVSCALIISLISMFHWGVNHKKETKSLELEEQLRIIKSAKPLFWVLCMTQCSQLSGQLLVGVWCEPKDVVLFSIAQKTAMLMSFILTAVNVIAAPKISEAFRKNDIETIKKIALVTNRSMFLISIPMIIFIWYFANDIVTFFGKDMIGAVMLLHILVVGQFINFITGSVTHLLQMTGNEKLVKNNLIISTILLLSGFVIFLPSNGVYAAAIVTTIAISTENLLGVYQVKKVLGFNVLKIW